ncbi:MAG: hypothetical protein MAG551_01973 [Candidatus Scalindua arabica]|uniref:Uncharacterized protein n=1 Tax=Candidatus Scalindua arabica TaxID=1127984 RepID=A0A941W492_9BACT|nr:hypothetical protein [Candidatus Scalindua arabica]
MATSLPGEQQLNAFNRFCELLIEGAEKHGIVAVFVFLVFSFLVILVAYLLRNTLKTKDKEIERLVKERNRLQDTILKKRISTKQSKK